MKNTQRILLAVYLFLTLGMLWFNWVYGGGIPSLQVTYMVRLSMFFTILVMRKKYWEQKMLVLAFAFTVLSDFFFVFVNTLDQPVANSPLYGMLGFVGAYATLIFIFGRHLNFNKNTILTLIPFVLFFGFMFLNLRKYATGYMFPAAIVLGIILCVTAAVMVSTIYSGYFSKKSAYLIALTGCLMFFSDIFVAYTLFHPDYAKFILWKDNLIAATYVPAWTILLLIASEEELYQ
ncbi:hypothetical protein DSECCO2_293460 [anaerobic digester metagenome]